MELLIGATHVISIVCISWLWHWPSLPCWIRLWIVNYHEFMISISIGRLIDSWDIWSISIRMNFPLWDWRLLSCFLFHSELRGWPHLCAELDGNGFFLDITSGCNFLVNKIILKVSEMLPILSAFLVINLKGKKMGRKWPIFTRQMVLPCRQ